MSLQISNASPIQFWLTGEETFNQKEVCSIYPVCFCQQIDPSDPLRLDIRDATDGTNYLVIYKDDGTVWKQYTFSATGFDHHQYMLIIDWDEVINRKLIFKIHDGNVVSIVAPTSWSDLAFTPAFTKSSTQFTASSSGASPITYSAKIALGSSIPSGTTITFPIIIIGGGSFFGEVRIIFYSGDPELGGSITGSQSFDEHPGTHNETVLITLSGSTTFLTIECLLTATGSAENVAITLPVGTVIYIPDSSILAQSDCVDIIEDDCTKLISYSNSTDFAGLGFPSVSPAFIYNLRIPAVFFEEDHPQEQEDLELSTDEIITLWSKIEGKKLLDIGFMPFYMHLKVQLALMMDSVSIDGTAYRMRDPYQKTPPASKRSALRKAQVLLSDKDFIYRNLL